jgi:hypothetical protein
MSNPQKFLVAVSTLLIVAASLGGCQSDTPVSPNAATAAPARLPGEDPHAPPARVRQHQAGQH